MTGEEKIGVDRYNECVLKLKLSCPILYPNKCSVGEGVKKPAAKKAPAAKKKTSPVNSDSEGGQKKKKQKTGGRKVVSESDDDDFVMDDVVGSSTAAPRGAAGNRFPITDVLLIKSFAEVSNLTVLDH